MFSYRTCSWSETVFLHQVPHVNGEEEHLFEVTVKGNDFYSYDATRVLIKSFHPKTLIQTDKHIYNQGEEGNRAELLWRQQGLSQEAMFFSFRADCKYL